VLSPEYRLKISLSRTGQTLSPDSRAAISATQKRIGSGGFRLRGGRGKQGWYKGVWCASSWELAFLVYHLDNNIPIVRCDEIRTYQWEGNSRRYFPDFVVNGEVVEIKGYLSPQWHAKLSANPDIRCIGRVEIEAYLKYAKETYGRDFIGLYEKHGGVPERSNGTAWNAVGGSRPT
jgi:hypothetical protein